MAGCSDIWNGHIYAKFYLHMDHTRSFSLHCPFIMCLFDWISRFKVLLPLSLRLAARFQKYRQKLVHALLFPRISYSLIGHLVSGPNGLQSRTIALQCSIIKHLSLPG